MQLYKFKSLEKMDHAIDIIINERLYCAEYKDLNDPCEGLYFSRNGAFSNGFSKGFDSEEINNANGKKRICSLSTELDDVRMWAHYANGHRGIAIEIDLENKKTEKVEYVDSLPRKQDSNYVLSKKLNFWEYEKEYRVITEDEFYYIKGSLRSIYLGHRIDPLHMNMISKITPPDIAIYETILNPHDIKIEKGECINGR